MDDLPDNVTLRFLGEQLARLLAERETDRADMLTIVGMIQRTEAGMAGVQGSVASMQREFGLFGQQLNNMHVYNRTLGERLRRLEETTAERFHRLEATVERLETTVAAGFQSIGDRLSGLESKLNGK